MIELTKILIITTTILSSNGDDKEVSTTQSFETWEGTRTSCIIQANNMSTIKWEHGDISLIVNAQCVSMDAAGIRQ